MGGHGQLWRNPIKVEPNYLAWWGFDGATERTNFEAVVDFMSARRRADPAMHIYHYAPYEPSALKRLAARLGTRVEEVDDLLRARVFVDLYRVVRQGIRASVESYSIKKLEPLYGLGREVALRDAGSSIVRYEAYIRSASAGAADESVRATSALNSLFATWRRALMPAGDPSHPRRDEIE